MDGQYVWMVECRGCLRFLNEAFDATLMSSDFGWEELQSDGSTELGILCSVDFSHSSRTDFADDAIVGQRSSGGKFSHCCFFYAIAIIAARNPGVCGFGHKVKLACAKHVFRLLNERSFSIMSGG